MAKPVSRNNISAARADPQTSLWKVENYLWFYIARIVNRSGLIYLFQNARKVCVALTEYYINYINYCGWRLINSWLWNSWLCKCWVYGVSDITTLVLFLEHHYWWCFVTIILTKWRSPDLDQLVNWSWYLGELNTGLPGSNCTWKILLNCSLCLYVCRMKYVKMWSYFMRCWWKVE